MKNTSISTLGRITFALSLLGLSLGTAGCNTMTLVIQRGEVPRADLSFLEPYLGSYTATDENSANPSVAPSDMNLRLKGDLLVLSSSSDVVAPGCDSSIGLLRSVTVFTDENGNVTDLEAQFALNPGKCAAIVGPRPHLTFNDNRVNGESVYTSSILIDSANASGDGTPTVMNTRTLAKIK
jgi:hypothetical protein